MKTWTEDQEIELAGMKSLGWGDKDIAEKMGLAADTVASKWHRMRNPDKTKKPKATYTVRTCLRCGKGFRSEGSHNRLCNHGCKTDSVYKGSALV